MHGLFDLKEIISAFGYVGLFGIVFAESGLLFGFFLPGDSLLVTAGLLASQDFFRIEYLLIMLSVAAVSGDSVGYWFGKKVGPKIFRREKSLFFDKKHLERSHKFYEKYGGKTILIARFVPIVRTFAPIVAGVGEMNYRKFISYNVFGGIFWVFGMLLLGYFLGNVMPDVDKYLMPLIALIVFLSLLPPMVEYYRENKGKILSNFYEMFTRFVKRVPLGED